MKELYRPKSKFRSLYFKRILALLAIFLVGLVFFSFFDSAVISTFSPLWKAENALTRSFGNSLSYFRYKKSLVDENSALKEEILSLQTKVHSSYSEEQKNLIGELLGRKQNSKVVIATVLTHPPQSPYDFLVIDSGSEESIAVGFEVSMPEGPLLGTVSEVFSKKARVKLFSKNGEKTGAVLERHNLPIKLVGAGGGNFKISLPRDIDVQNGDRILSADVSSRLLAVVSLIEARPTDAFKEVTAKSPTNIFGLRYVFVTP